jgi:hypothetical protein
LRSYDFELLIEHFVGDGFTVFRFHRRLM